MSKTTRENINCIQPSLRAIDDSIDGESRGLSLVRAAIKSLKNSVSRDELQEDLPVGVDNFNQLPQRFKSIVSESCRNIAPDIYNQMDEDDIEDVIAGTACVDELLDEDDGLDVEVALVWNHVKTRYSNGVTIIYDKSPLEKLGFFVIQFEWPSKISEILNLTKS